MPHNGRRGHWSHSMHLQLHVPAPGSAIDVYEHQRDSVYAAFKTFTLLCAACKHRHACGELTSQSTGATYAHLVRRWQHSTATVLNPQAILLGLLFTSQQGYAQVSGVGASSVGYSLLHVQQMAYKRNSGSKLQLT